MQLTEVNKKDELDSKPEISMLAQHYIKTGADIVASPLGQGSFSPSSLKTDKEIIAPFINNDKVNKVKYQILIKNILIISLV